MKRNSYFLIIFSFLCSFLLTILKLPDSLNYVQPVWVALVVCYWVLMLPHHVNLATAWTSGIILDVLTNTLLGEHALGLVVIAYLAYKFHRQIRMFPLWQQSASIMLLTLVYLFILFWIQGITGPGSSTWLFWMPALTSALFWPFINYLFRSWRHRTRIF